MVWSKLLIVLLGCCALPTWAADPWCTARGKAALRFEWLPQAADGALGSVRIVRADSGKTLQVIEHVENYRADGESLDTRDFNNDGCGDLAVLAHMAGIGNASSTVYLYDRKRRQFVENAALSNIGGLELDERDRNCVNGGWKTGADRVQTERHCWSGGKLVLKGRYSMAPRIGDDGEFECYEHVETEYIRGRAKTRKTCTKKY